MILQQARADLLAQAAAAEIAAGRIGPAAALLEQALSADPAHPMALTQLTELALVDKDYVRALLLTDAALHTEPSFGPAWYLRSSALWMARRQTDAVAAAGRAVDIQPANPVFRLRLAQFSAWTGDDAGARAAIRPLLRAEQQDPAHAAAIAMQGELAIAQGRFRDALPHLDRALHLMPDLALTRMQRGMNLLRLGRFPQGWADYAAREHIQALNPVAAEPPAGQVWESQDLTGRTLLVSDDQGHGDAIQFFRYLPLLRAKGAAHITWRSVGLVWSGDARHPRDHLRSIPADLFLTLADQPGIRVDSLQHDIRPSDLPAIEARPAIRRAVEHAAGFAETAALITELDLVIAVDTAVAHLAGALGKTVWLILHVAPDWRWLTDRTDSPWYPTLRLFRVTPRERRRGAGWGPVLHRVKMALQVTLALTWIPPQP
jgi:Flp pilus assembly protein TadD